MSGARQLDESERRIALAATEGVMRDAHINADLVIRFLEALDERASTAGLGKALTFSRDFLLELSFVLRIYTWERAGIRDRIGPGLPPARVALAELFARHGVAPGSKGDPGAGERLSRDVMMIALGRLAWSAREELAVDVAIDDPSDGPSLEVIADFLWRNRHIGAAGE